MSQEYLLKTTVCIVLVSFLDVMDGSARKLCPIVCILDTGMSAFLPGRPLCVCLFVCVCVRQSVIICVCSSVCLCAYALNSYGTSVGEQTRLVESAPIRDQSSHRSRRDNSPPLFSNLQFCSAPANTRCQPNEPSEPA